MKMKTKTKMKMKNENNNNHEHEIEIEIEDDDNINDLSSNNINAPAIIVIGHSQWFKSFFRKYLPLESTHYVKDKKMANCSVVAFRFYWNQHLQKFGIVENTITPIYHGHNHD